jgi:hypothetical protein
MQANPLSAYIERVVAEAPPLSPFQRDRLSAILTTAGGVLR